MNFLERAGGCRARWYRTLRDIIKDAGLTVEQFVRLLLPELAGLT